LILKEFYSKDNIIKNFKIDDNSVRTSEVKSALIVCEAILRSALMSEESRGAHFRSDFPSRDDKKWMANIYSSKRKKEEKKWFCLKRKSKK
jgi:succinate dehydrogenase/fumarate reductase flavoprotein subunit